MDSISQSAGVYVITNTVNDKIYIGSTTNLRLRWQQHSSDLRLKRHRNSHLQRAYNKYGADAFRFDVLEYVMPLFVHTREQYWLNKLKPFGERGYNIARNTEASGFGLKRSAETRAKISASKIGNQNRTGMHHTAEAKEKNRLAHIGNIVLPETREKIRAGNIGKHLSAESIAKRVAKRAREWIVTSPDGNETRIVNLSEFCRERKLSASLMVAVSKGKRSHHKGWKCRRYIPE